MNAIIVSELGTQPELRDTPAPTPGTGETLVRVHASSVNPIDGAIAAGMLRDLIPHEVPLTLGRDFAGVVEQVGDGVSGLDAGDEVFGIVPMAGARGVHEVAPLGADAEIKTTTRLLERRWTDVLAPGEIRLALPSTVAFFGDRGLRLEPSHEIELSAVWAQPSPLVESFVRVARAAADGPRRGDRRLVAA